jgi:hypothetical protein
LPPRDKSPEIENSSKNAFSQRIDLEENEVPSDEEGNERLETNMD